MFYFFFVLFCILFLSLNLSTILYPLRHVTTYSLFLLLALILHLQLHILVFYSFYFSSLSPHRILHPTASVLVLIPILVSYPAPHSSSLIPYSCPLIPCPPPSIPVSSPAFRGLGTSGKSKAARRFTLSWVVSRPGLGSQCRRLWFLRLCGAFTSRPDLEVTPTHTPTNLRFHSRHINS